MEDTNDKISSEKQQEEKKRNNPVFSIKELDIDEDLEELDMRKCYQMGIDEDLEELDMRERYQTF